jgi:hypothetical protein
MVFNATFNKLMGSQPSTLDTNVLSIQNSLIYSIYDFSFNWIMDFKEKDVVWIKLCGYPWWHHFDLQFQRRRF